ncbi:twin-arginine translocase subunit TatC [Paenibacillus abyssi]|nr:twin-arginine translocase subunit TatC [Paenibacillus abyssi]
MPILEHIGELRKRLIAILLVVFVGLIIGLVAANPVYNYLMAQEPVNGLPLHTFSYWDGIGIYMKIAFIVALVLALPFTLFQVWSFVKPALEEKEQGAALRYIPFALLMLLLGFAFSYFVVFPMAYNFTTSVSERLGLVETYGVVQYFSFLFNIVIPISLMFELPLVIMFLTKLRILNPLRLRKMRRLAYFLMVVIGTFITPPDVISDLMVAVPLILLYEFSVFLSSIVYRKQLEKDAAWEEEFNSLQNT